MPSGIRIVSRRGGRITATVPVPVASDGTAGRKCPSCRRYFKVDAQALGDVSDLWCPYCGHSATRDEFLTLDQLRRIRSAFARLAVEEIGRMFDDVFRRVQRTTGPIQIRYERGRAELPPLLTYLEEGTVRERTCGGCGNSYAVFGIAIFCPFCGRRDGLESFAESIDAARSLLAAVVHLPGEQRRLLQAQGGEDRLAENAISDAVTAFEVFCKSRVEQVQGTGGLQSLQKQHGRNVFQRLDDGIALMEGVLGRTLTSTLTPSEWNELRVAFATRHVLTHNLGVADPAYASAGGRTPLGQRVQMTRTNAERALELLERVVGAM